MGSGMITEICKQFYLFFRYVHFDLVCFQKLGFSSSFILSCFGILYCNPFSKAQLVNIFCDSIDCFSFTLVIDVFMIQYAQPILVFPSNFGVITFIISSTFIVSKLFGIYTNQCINMEKVKDLFVSFCLYIPYFLSMIYIMKIVLSTMYKVFY